MNFRKYIALVSFLVGVFFTGVTPSQATDLIGGEAPRMLTPEEALKTFTMAEGFEISLWASEVESDLRSPTAMTFDAQGRLWVANIPSHPHAKPDVKPADFISVLEDTDKDGKADKSTIFYDDLYLPMGLALADGGKTVFVASEPNLVRLTDKDGDLNADDAEIMLHGFGTEDNHHFISAFQWGPGGRLFFGQGLFLNTQVETPFGPVRAKEGSVFRLDPRNHKMEVFGSFGWSNVWGITFDRWGQPLLADASPAMNYYLSHMTGRIDYPKPDKYSDYIKMRGGYSFTPTGRRPSCGNELLAHEHFPEEVRGWYTTNQMKGWHGVRWYRLKEEGSGYVSDQPRGEEELLTSTDMTFRPVAQQIGPDGALYVLDYYNPIVGHTTYSFRDSRRIQTHGRVWRISAKGRDPVWQPNILGEPESVLLDLLKSENDRWRYFSRRELQQRSPDKVAVAVKRWTQKNTSDHQLTEALWIYQGIDRKNPELLKRLLKAKSADARVAAVRVLRFWQETMEPKDSLALLDKAIVDDNQRVRLEAMVAAGFHPDSNKSIQVAAKALDLEIDHGFELAARDTLRWLSKNALKVPEKVETWLLPHLTDDNLLSKAPTVPICEEILRRPKLPEEEHRTALMVLGRPSDRFSLDELLFRLNDPEIKDANTRKTLNALLLKWKKAELGSQIDEVRKLAEASVDPASKTNATAILIRLGEPVELNPKSPLRWLGAASLAGRGAPPAASYDQIVPLLKAPQKTVKVAAIQALTLFPDRDVDSLKSIASFVGPENKDITLAFTALDAMRRIPKANWPAEFENKTLTRIRITSTPNLRFDPAQFSVKTGSAVELTFFNPDNLYHNLAIVKSDALERIGIAADQMAADPQGLKKNYVPDDPGVLHFTPQITIGMARSHVLRFYAPEEPGEYPYICTYPGHWRAMKGVMTVVK